MSLATSFEELEIWKLAREIVKDIYRDFAHFQIHFKGNRITPDLIGAQKNRITIKL